MKEVNNEMEDMIINELNHTVRNMLEIQKKKDPTFDYEKF